MSEFVITRDQSVVEDAVYDVDPLEDTANPFGTYAVVKIDDRGGTKFDAYARGTRIDIEITPDNPLFIASGDTVTTNTGITDRYTTVENQGTYENQGTVESSAEGSSRFTGYVVERREVEQGGADALEVEAYSFDQFLRRNTVTNDQTGNTITAALQDIIQTDTPVTYNAANIEVGDDQTLTRSYQGRPVETALRDLAFKSENEAFGVNDSLEFYFRPRETQHIDRGIDNTQWFNYDIPELGKETINEVEVWYDDGNKSVVVDDPADKLDLQEGLSLPDPGTQRAELNRPLITELTDAEDIGRKYLTFRAATLSGTVTTFGLYDAEPGDTINVEIQPRGIDDEFVIVGSKYRWGRDETVLSIVEKRGDVDDILTELSDSVQRVEMEGADRTAASDRITTTAAGAVITPTVTADKTDSGSVSNSVTTVYDADSIGDATASIDATLSDGETASIVVTIINDGTVLAQDSDSGTAGAGGLLLQAGASVTDQEFDEIRVEHSGDASASWSYTASQTTDGVRFVNEGRRAVRDGWIGNANPDISSLLVGDDASGLSRSNARLRNQVASTSVSQSLPDSTTAEYAATITQTGVEELGLETSGGDLICRATFGVPVDLDTSVSVALSVSNDTEFTRGVLTNDGEEAVRDVLADNNPSVPTDYAYGSDGTAVSESDTALGNELVTRSLKELTVATADTTTEWEAVTEAPDPTDAYARQNNALESLQSLFLFEAEDMTGGVNVITESGFSGGEGHAASDLDDNISATFTTDYTIPASNVAVKMRKRQTGDDNPSGGILIDGEDVAGFGFLQSESDPNWDIGSSGLSSDLQPGSHTVEVEVDGTGNDPLNIDIVTVYDDRFTYNFDNQVDANDALSGPGLFPDLVEVDFIEQSLAQDVVSATVNQSWDDTTGNQFVEARIGSASYTRANNSDSVTATGNGSTIDVRVGLGSYNSGQTVTPTDNDVGQTIDTHELLADPDAEATDDIGATLIRAVIPPGTIVGDTVREAGLKNGSTLLTRHELAEFEVQSNQRLSSSETTRFRGPMG